MTEDLVDHIIRRFTDLTDAGSTVRTVADWFLKATGDARENGGNAAVEIGVRSGGMSAIFCELAGRLYPNFAVLSVDPYGHLPMYGPGSGATYGADHYRAARKTLAEYDNSVLFRMPSADFIERVLPWYQWSREGRECRDTRRCIAFAWVDGQHDDVSVVNDVSGLVPYMAPGGIIGIDNTEDCPVAIATLRSSRKLGLTNETRWQGDQTTEYAYLKRVAFTVPS